MPGESTPTSMPVPSPPLALLSSIVVFSDSSTAIPPWLPRTSLARIWVLLASSVVTPGPPESRTTFSTTRTSADSMMLIPPPPAPSIRLRSMTALLDGSNSSPTMTPGPRLCDMVFSTTALALPPIIVTPPPPPEISLRSTRLALACSMYTPSRSLAANWFSRTSVSLVPL